MAVSKWAATLVAAALSVGTATSAQALSAGCTAFQGAFVPGVGFSGSTSATGFAQGEVITLTITGGGASLGLLDFTQGITVAPLASASWSYTFPADTPDFFSLTGTFSGTISWSCAAAAAASGGSPQAISQNIVNAQTAVTNGQQSLRTMNDWISKGVIGTFSSGNRGGGASAASAAPLTARVRLNNLVEEERALAEDRAARRDSQDGGDVGRRLDEVRNSLKFARLASAIVPAANESGTYVLTASATAAPTADRAPDATRALGDAPVTRSSMPAVSASLREAVDYCGGPDVCDAIDAKKWNAWIEARVISANDSLAQTNGLGFVGTAGGDYKLMPWLAAGLSVGAESFNTSTGAPGLGTGSKGLTAAPYIGIRLQDNVFVSLFAGATSLNYTSTPAASVTAQFSSLRLFVGGALSGVWREGPWRFQPTLAGTYASEQQYGYSDSTGTAVSAMTVNYGRLSAGPEVGYTLWQSSDWALEPFVLAKANLDFTSSNVSTLNGVSVTLRPGTLGSGSAGGGVELRSPDGFRVRLEGSYESIGVIGLDVWSGLVRGAFTF